MIPDDANTLTPITRHPLLWALERIAGMSHRDIRRATNVSSTVLARMARNYTVRDSIVRRLSSLLKDRMRHLLTSFEAEFRGAIMPTVERQRWGGYRKFVLELTEWVAAYYDTPLKVAHETRLERDLRSAIGTGAFKSKVVTDLKLKYRQRSIYRCADRIGVKTFRDDNNRVVWAFGKVQVKPRGKRATGKVRTYQPLKNSRQSKIWNELISILTETDEPTLASEVILRLRARKFSKVAIYKAARDLRLLRETRGFGPGKRTLWALPHSRAADDVTEESLDGVVELKPKRRRDKITVDFTPRRSTIGQSLADREDLTSDDLDPEFGAKTDNDDEGGES